MIIAIGDEERIIHKIKKGAQAILTSSFIFYLQ